MTELVQKIGFRFIPLCTLWLGIAVIVSQPSLADHTKKTTSRTKKNTSALKYATPGVSAAEVVVTALGRQVGPSNRSVKTHVANDTANGESRIIFVRTNSDVFTVKIELSVDEANIDLGIYNMIGKKMADVYRGPSVKGEREFTTSISDLPEGVYICILQTSNTRRAEKFYLSR